MTLKNPNEPATDNQMNFLKDLKINLDEKIPEGLTQIEARILIETALENKREGRKYDNTTPVSEPKENKIPKKDSKKKEDLPKMSKSEEDLYGEGDNYY